MFRQAFSPIVARKLMAIVFAAATAMYAFPLVAQESGKQADESAAEVPVKRVVLFNSGVGYVEHRGKVDGDATVDLKFDVKDINDLLKSMVLQDLSGGQVSTVTYGSRDPITRTLQTFAIDLTQNPTLGQLLNQIRGERVEIEAPTKVDGTIVGVELKRQPVGERQVVDVEYLNVLTDAGLRRVPLDSIASIRLSNNELDKEFRQALGILAKGHSTDKKTVTLKFLGEGNRDVRVGYIQEAPVWKTSYRLVLDEKEAPFLQGWAIVENTTDADWKDVELSLVSGRPISFVMDLYSPLYAQRPTVVPEMFASLRPQVYEQDLARRQLSFDGRNRSSRTVPNAPASPRFEEKSKSVARSEPADSDFGGIGGGGTGGSFDGAYSGETAPPSAVSGLEQSVANAADGGNVGELFQYNIKTPVTLARQRSAMLPIINDKIEGQKVSIYNAGVHARHPLNGVELKNSSDVHLMQGPITVFDGGVYAGDARIPDLPPGSDRLLSYALDLDVEVAPSSENQPHNLLSARIEKGVLIATYKQSRKQKYTVKNSGEREKRVLIEHPSEAGWKLVTPDKPTEKTRDTYRFAVNAEPGKPVDLLIEEQHDLRQHLAINNLDDSAIQLYLDAQIVSESIKESLREVSRRKSEINELERRSREMAQEVATIGQEQQRIRENMKSIDRNTDLYNRYVKKFTEQEDRIETVRDETRKLQQQITEAKRSLDDYLNKLVLD